MKKVLLLANTFLLNYSSSGDVFIFDTNEVVAPDGTTGFLEGECMYLEEISGDKLFCTITFAFDGISSKLLVSGLYDSMVINGGTGCFFGLKGTVSGSDTGDGVSLEYSFTLDAEDSALEASCEAGIFENPWTEGFGDTLVDYNGDGEVSRRCSYMCFFRRISTNCLE